jgi:hypothetical protein
MMAEKEIDEIKCMGRSRKRNENGVKSRRVEDGIRNVKRGHEKWATGLRNVEKCRNGWKKHEVA